MSKLKIDYKESLLNAQKYIEKLEKENAELKEHHKSVCETLTNMHRSLREQLTKAKEIIKEFVCHYNNKTIYVNNVKPLLEQAEQFLNSEVEK